MNKSLLIVTCDFLVLAALSLSTGMVEPGADSGNPGVSSPASRLVEMIDEEMARHQEVSQQRDELEKRLEEYRERALKGEKEIAARDAELALAQSKLDETLTALTASKDELNSEITKSRQELEKSAAELAAAKAQADADLAAAIALADAEIAETKAQANADLAAAIALADAELEAVTRENAEKLDRTNRENAEAIEKLRQQEQLLAQAKAEADAQLEQANRQKEEAAEKIRQQEQLLAQARAQADAQLALAGRVNAEAAERLRQQEQLIAQARSEADERLRQAKAEAEEKLAEAKKEKDEVDDKLAQANLQIIEQDRAIRDSEFLLQQADERAEEARKAKNEADEKLAKANEEKAKADALLEAANKAKDEADERLRQAKAEADEQLKQAKAEADERLKQARSDADERLAEVKQAKAEADERLKQAKAEAAEQLKQARAETDEERMKRHNAEIELTKKESDLTRAQADLSKTQAELDKNVAVLNATQDEFIILGAKNAETEKRLQETETDLKVAQETIDQSRKLIEEKETQLQENKDNLEAARKEIRELENEIRNTAQSRYTASTFELSFRLVNKRMSMLGDINVEKNFFLPVVKLGEKVWLISSFRDATGLNLHSGYTKVSELQYQVRGPKTENWKEIAGPAVCLGEDSRVCLFPMDPEGVDPIKPLTFNQLRERGLDNLTLFKSGIYLEKSADLTGRCSLSTSKGNYMFIQNANRSSAELLAEVGDFVISKEGKFVGIVVQTFTENMWQTSTAVCFVFPDVVDMANATCLPLTKAPQDEFFTDFVKIQNELRDTTDKLNSEMKK